MLPVIDTIEVASSRQQEAHPAILPVSTKCPLLTIARELRDLIYEAYFQEEVEVTIPIGHREDRLELSRTAETVREGTGSQLFYVAKHLHSEALPFWRRQFSFQIQILDEWIEEDIEECIWQHIRDAGSVEIYLHYGTGHVAEQFEQRLRVLRQSLAFAIARLKQYQIRKVALLPLDLMYFRCAYPLWKLDVSGIIEMLRELKCDPGILIKVKIAPYNHEGEWAEVEKYRGLEEALGGSVVGDAYPPPDLSRETQCCMRFERSRAESDASFAVRSEHFDGPEWEPLPDPRVSRSSRSSFELLPAPEGARRTPSLSSSIVSERNGGSGDL